MPERPPRESVPPEDAGDDVEPAGQSLSALGGHDTGAGATVRVGLEIKRWREERGLSQAQLAARVGVDPSVMSRLEAGKIPDPRASLLHRVADALDVPVWTLLNAAGPNRGPDPRVLLRELGVLLHQYLPVTLPRLPTPASTTAAEIRRAPWVSPTLWVYTPQPGEEGHAFSVAEVAGDGFAPDVRDGDDVVIDQRATPRIGDLVLVRGRGAVFIRRVAGAERGRPVVVDPDGRREQLGPHRTVAGVVVERRQRVARGTVEVTADAPDAGAGAIDPMALASG